MNLKWQDKIVALEWFSFRDRNWKLTSLANKGGGLVGTSGGYRSVEIRGRTPVIRWVTV
jgi:hypothetical protein